LLLGAGASSDGHHMSSPHPEGLGAVSAMRAALDAAGIAPDEIGYVNLHGTGTRANDAMEDRAVHHLFGNGVPCSSTKGWTGHTLGASGAIEAVIASICLEDGLVPGCLNVDRADPEFRADVAVSNRAASLRHVIRQLLRLRRQQLRPGVRPRVRQHVMQMWVHGWPCSAPACPAGRRARRFSPARSPGPWSRPPRRHPRCCRPASGAAPGSPTRFALAAATEATGGRARPSRAGNGLRQRQWRRRGGGLHAGGAACAGRRHHAHAVPQLGAQRRGRLLAHRRGLDPAFVSLGGQTRPSPPGLLAAALAVAVRGAPVLLCAYDTPLPPPLDACAALDFRFAAALVLRPAPGPGALARLELRHARGAGHPPARPMRWTRWPAGNPAARALPLLRALAARRAAELQLPLQCDARLELRLTPC
jgi:hypothetical protein